MVTLELWLLIRIATPKNSSGFFFELLPCKVALLKSTVTLYPSINITGSPEFLKSIQFINSLFDLCIRGNHHSFFNPFSVEEDLPSWAFNANDVKIRIKPGSIFLFMAFMFTCTDYSPAKFSYHDLNSEIEWKKQRKKRIKTQQNT